MGAVNVCVSHDDNPMVSQVVGIKVFVTNAATQRLDQGADFRRTKHLVKPGLFHIQNLTLEW